MAQSSAHDRVVEADENLARLLAGVTIGWVVVFFLASLGLLLYGDVLTDLFV